MNTKKRSYLNIAMALIAMMFTIFNHESEIHGILALAVAPYQLLIKGLIKILTFGVLGDILTLIILVATSFIPWFLTKQNHSHKISKIKWHLFGIQLFYIIATYGYLKGIFFGSQAVTPLLNLVAILTINGILFLFILSIIYELFMKDESNNRLLIVSTFTIIQLYVAISGGILLAEGYLSIQEGMLDFNIVFSFIFELAMNILTYKLVGNILKLFSFLLDEWYTEEFVEQLDEVKSEAKQHMWILIYVPLISLMFKLIVLHKHPATFGELSFEISIPFAELIATLVLIIISSLISLSIEAYNNKK